jgi:hypothetical protein
MTGVTKDEIDQYDREQSEKVRAAHGRLPGWFVPRMMTDEWYFGLLLVTGHVLCISSINDVKSGVDGVRLDVNMLDAGAKDFQPRLPDNMIAVTAPTSRTNATIRADKIVAAFELADA